MKNKSWVTGICLLLFLTGCSGNAISEQETTETSVPGNSLPEVTVSEDVISDNSVAESIVSENAVSENDADSQTSVAAAPEVVFIPWEEAGLEDHVMEWGDAKLQTHMEGITGIEDREIMLSDVWEYTELDLQFYGEFGIQTRA